ncbi:unnamed protein product, partial [Ectocarpus sp. 4 AP-2014]
AGRVAQDSVINDGGSSLPYRVVEVEKKRGRACVAARSLTPGEVVLAERAVACVATPGRLLCDDCLARTTTDNRVGGIFQCVECRSVFGGSSGTGFSSGPECSTAVNDVHEDMRVSYSTVRLSAKILFRRCSGPNKTKKIACR